MSMPAPGEPLLRVAGLAKAFAGVPALDSLGFALGRGQLLGIVGENGSGKSTAMNIIAGVLRPDAGEMLVEGRAFSPADRADAERQGVGFIQQELNIFPNLTVAENLLLGRAPRHHRALPIIAAGRRRREARHWLGLVGLDADPDLPASRLGPGQRQLLEIARALSSRARILIFDEPTTSLTAREAGHLFALIGRLRAEGCAILFISHALDDVLGLADRVLVLRDGAVTLDAPRAGLTPAALVAAMTGGTVGARAKRPPRPDRGAPLLEVEGLGEPGLIEDISLAVRPGEILGIAGLMGAGRTELARILFGLDRHRHGSVRLDGARLRSGDLIARLAVGIAFLSEDRRGEGLMLEASVADNVVLAAARRFAGATGLLDRTAMAQAVAGVAERLSLKSGPTAATPIAALSGGNQQKALLGRWLLCTPRLLILDEPTRGVDVGARQDIYREIDALAAGGAGILLISSEIEELTGLADRILVMHRGRIAAEFARARFDRGAILRAAFGQGDGR